MLVKNIYSFIALFLHIEQGIETEWREWARRFSVRKRIGSDRFLSVCCERKCHFKMIGQNRVVQVTVASL